MANCYSFFVFAAMLISSKSSDVTLSTPLVPKKPDTCITKLSMCELDGKNLNFVGTKGERGDKGDTGAPGQPGHNGETGSKGMTGGQGIQGPPGVAGSPGSVGPRGYSGPKGDKGDSGKDGLFGAQGLPGHDGRNGRDGDPGADGPKGSKGSKGPMGFQGLQGVEGPKGFKGESGAPGISGTCGCYTDDDVKSEPETFAKDPLWGSKLKPATVTCKNAPPLPDKPFFYLAPGPMEVTCNAKKTCIKNSNVKNITYSSMEPFWLSDKGVTLKDLYNLDTEQLSWLQSESFNANLTIRYHCFNSKPLGDSSTDAMKLLQWNDVIVGPKPTTSSPIHYYTLKDGCSDAKDVWSYTDIYLVSPIAKRLPIIDFLINDVRNSTQALGIEIIQLCFG